MKEIPVDQKLIASCGLYCGACGSYLKGKCGGCSTNVKAEKWCKIKSCCRDNAYKSCADCKKYTDANQCKNFNNVFAKIFTIFFGSNRKGCVEYIKKNGYEKYAKHMAEIKNMSNPDKPKK